MPFILLILATVTLIGCSTYQGSEIWRRNACEQIVDADERAGCIEQATRSENEYKQDVENAKED